MKNRSLRRICALAVALMLLSLVGCGDNELEWDTTRDAVGAAEGDRIAVDQQWNLYRDSVVRSLEEMKTVLLGVREQAAVGERSRVDGLVGRMATLREDLVAEMDVPRDQAKATRAHLKETFDGLRNETNSLLIQLGQDRAEFRNWQDIE